MQSFTSFFLDWASKSAQFEFAVFGDNRKSFSPYVVRVDVGEYDIG